MVKSGRLGLWSGQRGWVDSSEEIYIDIDLVQILLTLLYANTRRVNPRVNHSKYRISSKQNVTCLRSKVIGFLRITRFIRTQCSICALVVGASLSEPHTSESLQNVRSTVSRNLVNHSVFGRTYVQQCHGIRYTSQDFVRSTVSRNSLH